ncbi:MAG TPA: PAS domain-containing protein [Azospirillum sp.]|nr:PAS domain-containing protein [Azospirillum sp.]
MPVYRRLLLVLLASMVPLFAIETINHADLRTEREEEIRQQTLRLLDLLRSEQERIVADVRNVLVTVAETGIAAGGFSTCQATMERLGRRLPRHLTIEAADATGLVRCSTDARAVGVSVADLPSFRDALRSDQVVLGIAEAGPRRGGEDASVLPFRLAVGGSNGVPAGVATILLDMRWLETTLTGRPMPSNAAILLTDGDGTVLARAPVRPGLVGSRLPEHYRVFLEGDRRAVVEMPGFDDVLRVIAYAPPAEGATGMMLAVGLDKEAAMRPVDLAALRSLGLFAGVLVLSAAGAAWGLRGFVQARERADRATVRMAKVLESTTDAVFELDRAWRFTFINDRARTLLPAEGDLVGQDFWDVFPEMRDTPAWAAFHEAIERRVPVEFEMQGPHSGRWYAASAFPSEGGIAVYCHDISARKQAEEERDRLMAELEAHGRELEAQRRLLEAVLRAVPVGLLAVEAPSGRLLVHSDATERMIGHPVFAAVDVTDYARHGAIHADGTPYRPEEYPLARALLAGEDVHLEEMLYRRGDGRIATFAVSALPVRDEHGAIVMAINAFVDISERKAMESALRHSEDRLNLALESAQAGTFEWDIRAGRMNWSARAYQLFGLNPDRDEATYATWERVVHPEDLGPVLEYLPQRFAERRSDAQVDYRVVHPDGAERWIELTGRITYDERGEPVRMVGLSIDVTERKAVNEALRKSREHLRLTLAAAGAGSWEWEPRTGRWTWSEAIFEQRGLDPERDTPSQELWMSGFHPDDRPMIEEIVRRAFVERRAAYTAEVRVVHPVRGVRWMLTIGGARYGADGRPERLLGVCIDITERKAAEEEMGRSQQRVDLALAVARAGTFEVDCAGGTSVWSDQTYRILGLDPERDAASFDTWVALLHPEDRDEVLATRARALADGLLDLRITYRIITPAGEVRWIEASAHVTYGEDGKPLRLTGIDADVTERRRMEAELRRAKTAAEEADRGKSRFLAAASHDLRQPLQSLFLFAAGLHGHVHNERGRNALSMIERNLDALKGLLDSLMDVSRLDVGAIRPSIEDFVVGPVLDHIGASFAPIARAKGIDLEVGGACEIVVRSDRHLLGRMLRNLVENAIKFTDAGTVRLHCHADARLARLEVADTGIGIPREQQERVFEEFHQLANPARDRGRGLGLGLSIVRRLSTLLEHPVSVRSEPGRGTVFTVLVPLGEARSVAPALAPSTVPVNAGGRLAVLVDDEPDVLWGLREMFRDWGYEAVVGTSIAQALERLAEDGRTPTVIVADYRLGDEGTGLDAVRRIRERAGGAVPAVILTGETAPEVREAATQAGVGLAIKPVTPRQLHVVLRHQLGDVA